MMYKYLKEEFKDNILIVTISKEESLNALNSELLEELNDYFTELADREDVKVVILTGAGKAFVAGADIKEMSELSAEEGYKFANKGMEAFFKIERLNKPVIAAINGFALGGGCELALSCDIRIASKKAKIGQPEVGLGITPGFGGTQRLPRAIGTSDAKRMIFTGEHVSADEAYRIGLVSEVVEPEELLDKALELANKIAKNSKIAVRYAKQAIDTGMQTDLNSGMDIERANFGLCFATEDQKEGMKAFLEKRSAQFNGK
ncbi:enoyl-CoA hydratase-related protein [Anaerosphaera multitolerans]|uniref:Enoyl-CoA hydratase/isomerase family protein n=1 Tax=Anaerosphaera multitolerans TaxID=2487351 RepID=A0A437S6N9_9FIRM|nr:enoyl-CoA hydratase-related protein [Anaerosphaera multitolerans]RVU54686.1 enoyl-CoA hydratase/isomerase family protein [Anaerosphaera multitolerans]